MDMPAESPQVSEGRRVWEAWRSKLGRSGGAARRAGQDNRQITRKGWGEGGEGRRRGRPHNTHHHPQNTRHKTHHHKTHHHKPHHTTKQSPHTPPPKQHSHHDQTPTNTTTNHKTHTKQQNTNKKELPTVRVQNRGEGERKRRKGEGKEEEEERKKKKEKGTTHGQSRTDNFFPPAAGRGLIH